MMQVEGKHLRLRLITTQDATYIWQLRTNPAYNTHLSTVTGMAEDQHRWIERYKEREAAGKEYYFIIERHDGVPCGTVRLYDFNSDSFTWGSWILDQNKPRKAALESAILVYCIAFDLIGLATAKFDVRRNNANTLAFHRRFGATETHADAQDIYFIYPRTRFEADRARHLAVLAEIM